jgi:hypothetical protein
MAPPSWQQIWPGPVLYGAVGHGGINPTATSRATMNGVGLIAPDPTAGPAAVSRVSPAYTGNVLPDTILVPTGGPINDAGQILARMVIGRSPRLVRLVAAEPCPSGCIRVLSIQMTGQMIGDPPGQCTPQAFNRVTATVRVAQDTGGPLARAIVSGRFLDDYYLDAPATGTTAFNSTVSVHEGPACGRHGPPRRARDQGLGLTACSVS